MTIDLSSFENQPRVLWAIPLAPLQGHRFQPTGFPGLGAATFQSSTGQSLLVESAQSMANRLELTCWNDAGQGLEGDVVGISHVRVLRHGAFLTDSILEAHRLNSPYLLEGSDKSFTDRLRAELGGLESGPVDRRLLAQALLKFDIGSLLHGVFLAKKDLAGGRLRVRRALSAFVEADDVRVAASGGVKNDHVNPSGDTTAGFGNVPFARDEFTAGRITLYVNLDLAQIRGYGLGKDAEQLLVLLALYKLRRLVDGALRFRTACDLQVVGDPIVATRPAGFALPERVALVPAVKSAIAACADRMTVTDITFNDAVKRGKATESQSVSGSDEDETQE